jgi:predicted dehydrogenase
MIKVAIVGTNGIAQLLCHYIATTTSHQFVILSRRVSSLPVILYGLLTSIGRSGTGS